MVRGCPRLGLVTLAAFNRGNYAHLDEVIGATDLPAIAGAFGPLLRPWPMDDPEVARIRDAWHRQAEQRRRFEVPLLDPPPAVHFERALRSATAYLRGRLPRPPHPPRGVAGVW